MFFEFNPIGKTMRTINETTYFPYKDYSFVNLRSYNKYIVLTAQGYEESPNAILAYKRWSAGGRGYLFSGIPWTAFENTDVRDLDFAIYHYNEITKVFVQPKESKSYYVYRLDNIRALIKDPDFTKYASGAVFVSNVSSFSLASGFFVGNNGSTTTTGGTGGGSTSSSSSSSSSLLLIVLIIFVILVVAAALVGLGYVLYRQNAKNTAKTYIEDTPEFGNSVTNNGGSQGDVFKSFDASRY